MQLVGVSETEPEFQRVLPEEQRAAVAEALSDMSRRPTSSQAKAGRILGLSQNAIHLAISVRRVGAALRDRVIEYLAHKQVIRDASVEALLDVYGQPHSARAWTWEMVYALPTAVNERKVAATTAKRRGVSAAVVARVLSRPPWTATEFAHRPTAWWTEEMLREGEAAGQRTLVSREKVAEVVCEDFERLRHAG